MAAQDIFNPGQESVNVTASPNLQTVQAQYDPNGSANKLIQALGADSTQRSLAEFNQTYEKKKLQDQTIKIDHYTQQFANDHVSGAVSQAQVKARFPEMVPVIAARVAESIGKNQGALDVAPLIEFVNGNDTLRLDTTARAAYIAQKREELTKAIPQGNDFYSAGVVSAMDRAFGEQELKWQGQTAAYHQEVQKTALSGEVVGALNGNDTAAALESIFQNYKMSSSINPQEFNRVAVDATIKLAAQSDDPSILQRLPQRYLNVDSKAAIFHANVAIGDQRWKNHERGRAIEAQKREDTVRADGLDVLGKLARNEPINSLDYKNPDSVKQAQDLAGSKIYEDSSSKAGASAFESSLLASSFAGSIGTQSGITKTIMGLQGINAADKADMIKRVPDLLKGTVLMNDEAISSAYRDNIAVAIPSLINGANANLVKMISGQNLAGNARRMYENMIQQGMLDFYKDPKNGGQWPGSFDKQAIVKGAISETRDYVERNTSLDALKKFSESEAGKPPTTKAGPSAQSTTPSASKGGTAGMSLVDQEIARRMKK